MCDQFMSDIPLFGVSGTAPWTESTSFTLTATQMTFSSGLMSRPDLPAAGLDLVASAPVFEVLAPEWAGRAATHVLGLGLVLVDGLGQELADLSTVGLVSKGVPDHTRKV